MIDLEERDWGNVRFRSRNRLSSGAAEDWASTRFVIGIVVFLAVALAYPWYSYWVQSRLLVKELEQGIEEATHQADAEVRRVKSAMEGRTAARTRQAAAQRIAAVRVAGVSHNRGMPVVVVKLGDASLAESKEVICLQAEEWLSEELSGKNIRVQKHRGNVAVDVGTVRC